MNYRDANGRWLRCAQPRPGAGIALLAFPHAGGSAAFFRSWGTRLAPGIELTAVQYPGRLDRLEEPCVDDVHALADHIVTALLAGPARDRRLALLGHSMGAALAFETALRLEAAGIQPDVMFLSGHPAPGCPPRNVLTEFTDDAIIAELRRLGTTPTVLIDVPEAREVLLAGLRGDYRAVAGYRPSPGRVSAPVVGLVGDDDPDVTPDEMRPWASRTAGSMTLHVFPGDHFYLVPERDAVLRTVAAHLGAGAEVPA